MSDEWLAFLPVISPIITAKARPRSAYSSSFHVGSGYQCEGGLFLLWAGCRGVSHHPPPTLSCFPSTTHPHCFLNTLTVLGTVACFVPPHILSPNTWTGALLHDEREDEAENKDPGVSLHHHWAKDRLGYGQCTSNCCCTYVEIKINWFYLIWSCSKSSNLSLTPHAMFRQAREININRLKVRGINPFPSFPQPKIIWLELTA